MFEDFVSRIKTSLHLKTGLGRPHDALFKAALTDDDDDVVMEFVERLLCSCSGLG